MAVKKLSELTVAELRHELKKRKLEIVGDKATLLARLKKSLVEDAMKSKAASVNKEDQNKKTQINTESTSEGSKDVFKPQTEESNANKQLETLNSNTENEVTSSNISAEFKQDPPSEDSNLSKKNQVQPQKPSSESIGKVENKVTENLSNVDHALKTFVESNCDTNTFVDSTKEVDNQKKAEVQSEKETKTVKDTNENLVIVITGKQTENIIPFLNDNTSVDCTLKGDDEKKTLNENSVMKTNVTHVPQHADGTSVKKVQETAKASDSPSTLWVSGLVGVVKASDLKQAFGKLGKVLSAKIVTSTKNPGSKCFGLITMQNRDDAIKCINNYHNKVLLGSTVTVEFDTKNRVTKPIQFMPPSAEPNIVRIEEKMNVKCEIEEKVKENVEAPKQMTDALITSTPMITNKTVPSTNVTPIAKSILANKSTQSILIEGDNVAKEDHLKNETQQKPTGDVKNSGMVSTSVWFSGLPNTVKAADLKTLCLAIGKVIAAKVVASAKSTTYFGLVTMATKEDADGCVKKLDKSIYQGKTISCEMSPYNNVTPDLLKHFSKVKNNQQQQQSTDKVTNNPVKDEKIKLDNKKTEVERKNEIKVDKDVDKEKVKKSTGSSSNVAGEKSNQNQSGSYRNKVNSSPKNRNNRNFGNSNFRRNNYSSSSRNVNSNKAIPSLFESNPFDIVRFNSSAPATSLFNANFCGDNMRSFAGRNRLELEKLEAERANALMMQEQRYHQQQMMTTFRGDGWSQAPSRMKRSHEEEDVYWGPPPQHMAPKRYLPSSTYNQPMFGDERMRPGPQNYW